MEQLWQRIEAWVTKNFPEDFYVEGFGPVPFPKGASEKEIEDAEKKLKTKKLGASFPEELRKCYANFVKSPLCRQLDLRLPPDIRQSYLVHNGCPWVLEFGDLLPVESIPEFWAMFVAGAEHGRTQYGPTALMLETTGPVKKDWWNPHWIPLTNSGGAGNCLCVDLDPAADGEVGQVVFVEHEYSKAIVLANSFGEWLGNYADDLDAGYFRWADEDGGFVRVGGRNVKREVRER